MMNRKAFAGARKGGGGQSERWRRELEIGWSSDLAIEIRGVAAMADGNIGGKGGRSGS
jgi:hypothetical protein